MRKFIQALIASVLFVGLAYGTGKALILQRELVETQRILSEVSATSAKNALAKDKLDKLETDEVQRKALVEFTLTAMDMEPKSRISQAKKTALAEKLARAVVQALPTLDSREQYISMVKIESNFENSARSPVGATGIGQIMPATFNGTIKKMDIDARPEDITNEDVNLAVGAFYFNELLNEQKGNPRLASIAYNGGGRTAEKFKKMVDINPESSNYALKTEHVKDTVRDTIKNAADFMQKDSNPSIIK